MSKPKIYELWFSDYDSNSSWQFTHPKNKFKMEFEQDCQYVLKEFAGAYIDKYTSWIGAGGLAKVIADNLPSRGYIPFDETFENISFGFGGSYILKKEDEKYGDNTITELLGHELKNKVYKKNRKIENNL